MIAYEGLQKYFESCNTASTKRKLSLLIFDPTEHCRGCDDDYVSEHASNKLQMFADLSDATVPSQVDGRPPVLTATSQSNGNGQTLTTHRIQTP